MQINFARDRTVSVWRAGTQFHDYKTNKLKGFGIHKDLTLGLDFTGLVELLSIPRQFRKVNPYTGKLVRIVPENWVKTVAVAKSFKDSNDISWLTIQKAHSGLDLMWKSVEKSFWFESFAKNALTFAIGLIPAAGPLLSVAFSLTWAAMKDEDAFWDELVLWVPGLKLSDEARDSLKSSFAEMRQSFIDPVWLERDKPAKVGKLGAKPEPVEKVTLDEANQVKKETEVGEPPEGQKADNPDGGEVIGIADPGEEDDEV